MTSLADRLTYALSEAKKNRPDLSKSLIAKYCGVRPSTVTDWFSGKTLTISRPYGEKTAELLSVSSTWLISGSGNPYDRKVDKQNDNQTVPKGFVAITEYQIEVNGEKAKEISFVARNNGRTAWYSLAWFHDQHLNPNYCKLFEITDCSMEPLIWEKDLILVDCSNQEIIPGKTYAIYCQNRLFIRYLYPQPDGSFVAKSVNPTIPDTFLSSSLMFTLVGRVRERSGDKLFE